MTHTATPHHGLYEGHWITCACGWSGPSRPTRHLATTAYEKHVKDAL